MYTTIPLPPELEKDLLEAKPYLMRQGGVQPRYDKDRRRSYRVRYRVKDEITGKWVHKSIPLDCSENPLLVTKVERLLGQFRAEYKVLEAQEDDAKRRAKLKARSDRDEAAYIREVMLSACRSRRERQAVNSDLNALEEKDELGYKLICAFGTRMGRPRSPRRRPGRPRGIKLL